MPNRAAAKSMLEVEIVANLTKEEGNRITFTLEPDVAKELLLQLEWILTSQGRA